MVDKVPYSKIMRRMHGDINYIAEEAYRDGYDHCEKEMRDHAGESYQRGLDDAWKAARKIVLSPDEGGTSLPTLFAIFGRGSMQDVFRNNSASEAISKLKAYEKKQKADDEIKVGDEVAFHHDDRPDTVVVVTYIGQDGFIDGMDGRGTQYAHKNPAKWTKTGRHFDIESILEAMRE